MRRDDLAGLPPVELPAGYTLRSSLPGDGCCWSSILNEAFGGERTEESFMKEMLEHPAYRAERILFICAPDGEPCATASAYQQGEWGEHTGYVHYVAVRPGHAGKALGYQVSLAVLHRFTEEDYFDAVLQTDDFRVAAIKTYLRLGFHPLLAHENHPQRWRIVLHGLGIPEGTVQMDWRIGGEGLRD